MRDRMRAGRSDAQSVLAREANDLAAQTGHLAPRLFDVLADGSADLDDRIVHLAFDLFAEPLLSLSEHFLDVRLQLPRLRIDDLELFFDAEREGGRRHGAGLCHPTQPRDLKQRL